MQHKPSFALHFWFLPTAATLRLRRRHGHVDGPPDPSASCDRRRRRRMRHAAWRRTRASPGADPVRTWLHAVVLQPVELLIVRDDRQQRYGTWQGLLPRARRPLRLAAHLSVRAPLRRRRELRHLHRQQPGPQASLHLPHRLYAGEPVRRSVKLTRLCLL